MQQKTDQIKMPLVLQVSRYIFKITKIFGLYKDGDFPDVSGGSNDELTAQLMDVLTKYRDSVKQNADNKSELFKLSDSLRDDILPYLGIRLEDKAKGEPSMWKFDDKDELISAIENKKAEVAKKAEAKRLREEEDLKKKSTSGKDWFKVMEGDKYK